MKYLVSLNGKQYEVIVEHHTANVTNVTSFVPERTPKESSIENKQTNDFPLSRNTPPKQQHCCKGSFTGNHYKFECEKWPKYKTRRSILCILEAMKMENEIIAPADGTIIKTEVQQGSAVQTDDILVVIG